MNTVNTSMVNSTIIKYNAVQSTTVHCSAVQQSPYSTEGCPAPDTGSNHVLLQWSGLEAGMCEYSALQLALFTVRCALNIVYIMRGVMCTV